MNIKLETVELIYIDVFERRHLKDNTHFHTDNRILLRSLRELALYPEHTKFEFKRTVRFKVYNFHVQMVRRKQNKTANYYKEQLWYLYCYRKTRVRNDRMEYF